MGLGAKREDLTPWANRPNGTHPSPKHVFGCTERKSTLLRVSCGRIEGTKKINKKHARVQLHPYAHPTPIFGGHLISRVWSDCGRNHTCQISSESVQAFRRPSWPKMTIHIDLAHRPYNSARNSVLHCDKIGYIARFCIERKLTQTTLNSMNSTESVRAQVRRVSVCIGRPAVDCLSSSEVRKKNISLSKRLDSGRTEQFQKCSAPLETESLFQGAGLQRS